MAQDTQWLSYSNWLQLTTWGHSDTSGVDTIDCYVFYYYMKKNGHKKIIVKNYYD